MLLTRLETSHGGAVDVCSLHVIGVLVREFRKPLVEQGQSGVIRFRNGALSNSQEVKVARYEVKIAHSEGAAQVYADEVARQRLLDAGQQGIEHRSHFPRKVHTGSKSAICLFCGRRSYSA